MLNQSIQTLSSDVIDQIAAGEVVERPAHLIKELVENSLDAGATEIFVEFSEGGRFAKVTDNGSGISQEDLPKALDRHATSKIKMSSDLFRLNSFGFRGEALASIAAVSRLTLISKRSLAEPAFCLLSEFGHRSKIEKKGGSVGTSVLIEDLFSNVPARLKFMKSASAEGTRIKTTLKALALSHPQVLMKVIQSGELIHVWPACENHLQRARQVLAVPTLFEGFAERGSVRARAIFADPKTVQRTARDLWFFAQNRWIQDRSLQAAVLEAYRHLLMHGEYPIAAVWIETHPEEIDVNIHPTKSQVKFADSSLAFRAVHASIRDVLETAPWLPSVQSAVQRAFVESTPDGKASDERSSVENLLAQDPPPVENLEFQSPDLMKTQFAQKNWSMMEPLKTYRAATEPIAMGQAAIRLSAMGPAATESTAMQPVAKTGQTNRSYWSSLQVLGQAKQTYILTQGGEGLVIVDQHAAHERVMFEKLMAAWRGGRIDIQEYLFPLAVDLTTDKVEALIKEKEQIARLGISIEILGPETIGVKAAPALLKESALSSVLEKMSQELVENGGSFRLERKIGDLVATLACHSAIRAGQALSLQEMRALLENMDEFSLSSFCPHGRPVSVEYPFYRLEKDFGRLV